MVSGKTHTIFTGRASAGTNTLFLQVRKASGGYEVRVGTRLNSGTTKYTVWSLISDAPHSIEIGWTAATTTSGTNGALSLWIDGSTKPGVTKLANGSQRVDDARLGPQTIPTGISGVELFDGFVSTVTSYIGT